MMSFSQIQIPASPRHPALIAVRLEQFDAAVGLQFSEELIVIEAIGHDPATIIIVSARSCIILRSEDAFRNAPIGEIIRTSGPLAAFRIFSASGFSPRPASGSWLRSATSRARRLL